jgi:hypothetical protein
LVSPFVDRAGVNTRLTYSGVSKAAKIIRGLFAGETVNLEGRFLKVRYRLFPSIMDVITVVKPETVNPVASAGLSSLLALEIPPMWWPSRDRRRDSRPHPTDEQREPAVGSAADTWRIADAGIEVAQSTVARYTPEGTDRPRPYARCSTKAEHIEASSPVSPNLS